MRARRQRIRLAVALIPLLALLAAVLSTTPAQAGSTWRTVTYRGYTISVPRSWPVYDLSRHPRTCVRFNRHAVYLGTPGDAESCPNHAAGRSEAILLAPAGASAARATDGLLTSFISHDVRVVASWSRDRALILRALHRRWLPAARASHPRAALEPHATRPAAHAAQSVYTGLGFDACSAPSPHAMAAWGSSPYRALGIYIGGVNSACAQPNLSSSWIASQSAAGWHMIPTYVGPQAPNNSCGCSGISASQASAQGTAAAQDAVSDAQTLGLPPDSPIYDDMEYYSRTAGNTSAVMSFLSAWTTQLHADGYLSGVYGNSNSVIADLVARYGTSYPEPDDIWTANWNNQATTTDSAVPAADWSKHQRLHQYKGGHNETYGGVTINIDSDYLDGATATGGSTQVRPPTLSVAPLANGITNLSATWGGAGLASWQVLAGTDPGVLAPIASAKARGPKTTIAVRSAAPYVAVQAFGTSGQLLGSSPTVSVRSHLLLFGRSVFVSARSGMAGVPVGCYLPKTCHLATTVTRGRLTLARTGTEAVAPGSTGLVFFRLTGSMLRLLNRSSTRRLAVRIALKDVSGTATSAAVNLIPFSTRGRAPAHSLAASPLVRPVGSTDFVYARGAGGILTSCAAIHPCRVSATLSVGRTTIASTRPEVVGGRELGYVIFSLRASGRRLLDLARGNQLAANLTLRSGSSVSRARITLVQFS